MNSLGSSREIVQNKLIIMYMIDRLNMPVSNSQITGLVLETRLMNYFMFQQCFNELHDGKLIGFHKAEANQDDPDGFRLTRSGKNTLQYFLSLIPPGIKKQMDNMLPDARKEIQTETLVTADFLPESENKFTVTCKMNEKGFPLMELKATVGTKKDARTVCDNWKNHSPEIYAEIIQSLIKNREQSIINASGEPAAEKSNGEPTAKMKK
ncbi:MAG: DUF4364 family protein [Clostridiaceae bacterium]